MTTILPVKGTRDFYPDDLALRDWLYQNIKNVSQQYGYQEYDGPFMERLELYAAKSGEELVKEQAYVFPDRSGDMVALRPELTPSLARMVAARSKQLSRPIRWWSFGPFWRYERPQRGRTREFFQWNIDILGIDSPAVDAELASIAADFFRSVGLPPTIIRILVNDRRLVDSQLDDLGIPPQDRPAIFRLIDRREKLSPQQWQASVLEAGLTPDQYEGLQSHLSDYEAWKSLPALVEFFETADLMGASEYLSYDPTVIRGLDYYTGTVFEARDTAGKYRAILGGGRYDDLVSEIGGDPVPGTGFAMGDVVIGLVLKQYQATPTLRSNPAQVLMTTFSEDSLQPALELAGLLRNAGLLVEWYPTPARLPKQLKYADRQGIPVAVIQGPDELSAGQVTVKDLRVRRQYTIQKKELIDTVRGLLEPS